MIFEAVNEKKKNGKKEKGEKVEDSKVCIIM